MRDIIYHMAKVKDKNCECDHDCGSRKNYGHHGGNGMYGLGMIGAAVFYLQHSNTFQEVVVAILKAIFWPAFFVYRLLEVFKF